MSILLESLTQSGEDENNNLEKNVPNLDDSHFDDEMFSDESLLNKVKFWKILSIVSLICLTLSWAWFYYLTPFANENENEIIQVQANPTSDKVTKVLTEKIAQPNETKQTNKAKQTNKDKQVQSNSATQSVNEAEVDSYQPKKRLPLVEHQSDTLNQTKKINQAHQLTRLKQRDTAAKESIIEFESLSEKTISEMPEFEISSYAVSSNAKKSFVVLNGAFYGEGELISPNMTLIKISQDYIVVKYKGQLIRKKYSS